MNWRFMLEVAAGAIGFALVIAIGVALLAWVELLKGAIT